MGRVVIGIDIGTTGTKTMALDANGEVKARSYYEYAMHHPKPGWFEQSPQDIWSATICTIKEVMNSPRVKSRKVAAVCFSVQGGTLVLVDRHGNPIRPAITWLDKRAVPQCSTLTRIVGLKSMLEACGREPAPVFVTPKILWLRENEPAIFNRTEKFLQVQDFVIMRLTGKCVTDVSSTSFLEPIIFDVKKREWSQDMLSLIELSEDRLPELRETGDLIGEVTAEIEMKTQLPSGTPVVLGGHDQCMAAVGAGAIEPGVALLSAGTAWALLTSLESPISNSAEYLCYLHAVRGKWTLLTSSPCGVALRWFRDQLGGDEMDKARLHSEDPYDLLTEKAADVRPGSGGLVFLPYLAGALDDSEAKGCFVGLTLAHTKAHLIRAVLEGTALEVLRMTEIFEKTGIDVGEYRFIGGASKSALWRQITADTTQRVVITLKNQEAASLGAAIVGGESVGMFKNTKEGIQKAVSIQNRTEPRKDYERVYNKKRQVHREIYKSLKPHWRALSA